jgi:hypothetical protein
MARDYFRQAGSWVQRRAANKIYRIFIRRNAALSQVRPVDPDGVS